MMDNTLTILIMSAFMAWTYLNNLGPQVDSIGDIWKSFKEEHGKQYENNHTEAMRRFVFLNNYERIRQFNANHSAELGFEVGLNHLGDISELEIKLHHKGFRFMAREEKPIWPRKEARAFLEMISNSSDVVPDAVDWRDQPGVVSQVKNQGSCGSCWAFASTGALEGQERRRLNYLNPKNFNGSSLVELSEQNLVDCVKKDYGCNGGMMSDAFELINDEGGIEDEKSYPYEARQRPCRFRRDKTVMRDSGSVILPQGNEDKLKEVVAKFGPVAVAIDASSIWFQFYRRGVYYDKHCKNKPDQLDHAVLVVGYGTDKKKGDYWIVKNSWGPKYGEKGYIRMSRNRDNNCGIASMATIPVFK